MGSARDSKHVESERDEPHPDINISKISFGGVAGLIFTLVMVMIFLVGLEEARWFLAVSIPLGLVVALILRWTARDRD
jgi:cytosine/uracil/thiamine/allantoin permease